MHDMFKYDGWEKYREKYFEMPDSEVIPDCIYEEYPDCVPVYSEEFGRIVPNQNDTEFWERYNSEDEYGKTLIMDSFTGELKRGIYQPGIISLPCWYREMAYIEDNKDLKDDRPVKPFPPMKEIIEKLIDRMEYDENDEEMLERARRGEWVRIGAIRNK